MLWFRKQKEPNYTHTSRCPGPDVPAGCNPFPDLIQEGDVMLPGVHYCTPHVDRALGLWGERTMLINRDEYVYNEGPVPDAILDPHAGTRPTGPEPVMSLESWTTAVDLGLII